MKRWLILALLGSPLWGAIAHVAGTGTPHVTSTSSTATSCAITYTPNAAGHLIVFALSNGNTAITSPTVSDNATGGTSTYVSVGQANNSTNELVTLWYTLSVKSGATTFTASWTTGSRNSCDLTEYSGVAGVGATLTGQSGAASPITAVVTTTAANSWIVMAGSVRGTGTYSTGSSCSPTASCTLQDSIAGGGSTTSGISLSDDGNVASSGTATTVHTTTTGTNWAAVALELMTTLPAPTLDNTGGSFANDQTVNFSDAQAGVTFCSTLDGTTPAATSPPTCSTGATGASTTVIATASTVKVIATKAGWVNSAETDSTAFTLTVGAVTDSPGAGTYTSAQTATLAITTTTGGTIHYTTDGTAVSCSSASYSTPLSVASTETIKALGCKTNYVSSSAISDLYTINIPTAQVSGGLLMMGVGGVIGLSANTVVGLMMPSGGFTSAKYFGIGGVIATPESSVQFPSPIQGTITAIYANAAVAPSGTDVVALRQCSPSGGTCTGSTVASCTISTGTHTCSSTGLSITLNQGDLIDGFVSTLSTASGISLFVRVTDVTSGTTVLPLFTIFTYATGSTRYWTMNQNTTSSTSIQIGAPVTGTITAMNVGSNVAATTGTEAFNIYDTGSSVAACNLEQNVNHSTCTGLSGALTKGHLINASAVNVSGSSAPFGTYNKLTADAQILPLFSSAVSASTTAYFSAGATATDAIASVQVGSPIGGTITEMYVGSVAVAAGTGNVMTLNINGSPTGVTCTMAAATTNCSTVGNSQALNVGDLISVTGVNSNTGATTYFSVYLRVESAN